MIENKICIVILAGSNNLRFSRRKKCKTRPITASNNDENITKKSFLESWEGLKSVKLVQIQHGTPVKNSQIKPPKGLDP